MISKKISFKTYMDTFYNNIKITGGIVEPAKTLIFYKIKDEVFYISFNYLGIHITTNKLVSEFKNEYDTIYNNSELISGQKKPDFIDWVDMNYMNSRGIKEI